MEYTVIIDYRDPRGNPYMMAYHCFVDSLTEAREKALQFMSGFEDGWPVIRIWAFQGEPVWDDVIQTSRWKLAPKP